MDNHRDMDQKIRTYLRGEMPDKDRYLFEKEMQKDPFLAEAVEGYSLDNNIEALTDLDDLRKKITGRSSGAGFPFLRVASVAIILLAISSVLLVRQLKDAGLVSESLGSAEMKREAGESPVSPVEDIIETEAESFTEAENVKKAQPEAEGPALRKRERVQAEEEVPVRELLALDALELEEEVIEDTAKMRLLESRAIAGEILDAKLAGAEVQADKSPISKSRVETLSIAAVSEASRAKAEKAGELPSDQAYISGRVIAADEDLPLPGVLISVKGTTRGTSTDIDGYFSLRADSGDILLASFVGMESKEVELDKSSPLDIVLEPSMMALEEVVVIGYGSEAITGSTATGAVSEVRFDKEGNTYQRPLPEGGMSEFRKYVSEKQVFPATWQGSGREVVRMRFRVGLTGVISELEIIKSPGQLFSDEAIRLLESGPEWNPAMVNDEIVAETVTVRIVFKR